MQYISTRGGAGVDSCAAIVKGIANNGGLYVPDSFFKVDSDRLVEFANMQYFEVAKEIMQQYLPEFSSQELLEITKNAYGKNYDNDLIVPLTDISDNAAVMELYRGNTLAFKDMALQVLPSLMTASMQKINQKDKALILVATSGDTGKAALEGFKDKPNTAIAVFYPIDGVSPAQKRQMQTQEGENVFVIGVEGNFDDAQNGVKEMFANDEFNKAMQQKGYRLSSANSINWGRLLPQIVYYFWGYAQLIKRKKLQNGQKVNFVVPTGNFGNILAGFYAKKMGLPINKLICASNQNKVLADFFNNGEYNKKRDFYKTTSPSMDILISSNLERLLFELCQRDSKNTAIKMHELAKNGSYTIDDAQQSMLNDEFFGAWCDDKDTLNTIAHCFKDFGYLIDTHTAVALNVYEQYASKTNDATQTVILSTASPYKFANDVLQALGESAGDEFIACEKLQEISKVKIPVAIKELADKKTRFDKVCKVEDMAKILIQTIK